MVSMKIEGLAALSKTFQALTFKQQRSKMNALLTAAAEPIQAAAERHVRVSQDAPHIIDHIVISPVTNVQDEAVSGKRRLEEHEFAVAIGPHKDFYYGFFLEFGTIKHPAHPFMRPGAEEGQAEAVQILKNGVPEIVADVARAAAGRNL